MSRGGDEDDYEDWPNQAAFWWANAKRALKGKRGKKALAELREALLMLPEKRLVNGAISTAALYEKYKDAPDTHPHWNGIGGQTVENWQKVEALKKCEKEGIGVCAVGAYMLRKRVLELGETPEEAMRQLPAMADIDDHGLEDTALVGEEAGLSSYMAYMLADRNDERFASKTPEERYDAFLAWIDGELANA